MYQLSFISLGFADTRAHKYVIYSTPTMLRYHPWRNWIDRWCIAFTEEHYLVCCRGFGKQGYQCQGKKVKTDLIGFTTRPGVTTRRNLGHILLVFQSVVSSFTSDVTNTWPLRARAPTKEPIRTWVPTLYLMPNTYPPHSPYRADYLVFSSLLSAVKDALGSSRWKLDSADSHRSAELIA